MCSPGNRALQYCIHSDRRLSFCIQICALPTISPISRYLPVMSHCNSDTGNLFIVILYSSWNVENFIFAIHFFFNEKGLQFLLVGEPWSIQVGHIDIVTGWQNIHILRELTIGCVRDDILCWYRAQRFMLFAGQSVSIQGNFVRVYVVDDPEHIETEKIGSYTWTPEWVGAIAAFGFCTAYSNSICWPSYFQFKSIPFFLLLRIYRIT